MNGTMMKSPVGIENRMTATTSRACLSQKDDAGGPVHCSVEVA
jgi:hypothetical protein